MVEINVETPRSGNALAVASMVLGIIAALISWIPFLGLLCFPVAALGLLLGVIGLLLALLGNRSGMATSIAGCGTSVLAVVLAISITGMTSKAIVNRAEKAKKEMPVAKADSGASTKQSKPPSPARPPSREAAVVPVLVAPPSAPVAELPKPSEPDGWVVAPKIAVLGDVSVRILSVSVVKVPLIDIFGKRGVSEDPALVIEIQVDNKNPKRKIDYRSWAGKDISFTRDYGTLVDDLENRYKRVTFPDPPAGRTPSDSIYPGKPLGDVLVFEVPLEAAEYLDLELPGDNVGTPGVFRIRIPTALIQR